MPRPLEVEVLWRKIPLEQWDRLLSNVWCGKCRGETMIVDFEAKAVGGDLVLRGRCAKCGGAVARHVETSQMPDAQN